MYCRIREERTLTTGRVDRAKGIIYGVKALGVDSPNNHQSGSTLGTLYTPECRQKAVADLEGAKVNTNHPSRSAPNEDRRVEEGLGHLENVRARDDGIFADLHCLTTHPLWPQLAEAAEKSPGEFALSINAHGRGHVIDGRYIVEELKHIQSVDLVRDGGSNRSLFESRERSALGRPVTLREVVAAVTGRPVLPTLRGQQARKMRRVVEAVRHEPPRPPRGGRLTLKQVVSALKGT